jgi:hypothetical protein
MALAAAEPGERTAETKGNAGQQRTRRTQSLLVRAGPRYAPSQVPISHPTTPLTAIASNTSAAVIKSGMSSRIAASRQGKGPASAIGPLPRQFNQLKRREFIALFIAQQRAVPTIGVLDDRFHETVQLPALDIGPKNATMSKAAYPHT